MLWRAFDKTVRRKPLAGAADASNQKATALFEAVAKANPNNATDQLNVAILHRIMSFSDLLQPSGRQNLEQAVAITERVMKTDGANPRVWSERAIEYQNLGMMQDAAGDRAHALESFQKNLAIKQEILKIHPEYHDARRGVGMGSVLVGDALARLGSRQEALQKMQAGISFYESVVKGGTDINAERDLAIIKTKRGEVQLMDGDFAAALASFRQARTTLEPMAKVDPQNNMLQLDMTGMDYEEGRLLASTGRYAAAIATLQRAIRAFQGLHTQGRNGTDIGPGLGTFYIWLGEAEAGKRNLQGALENYRKASGELRSPADQLVRVRRHAMPTCHQLHQDRFRPHENGQPAGSGRGLRKSFGHRYPACFPGASGRASALSCRRRLCRTR
jgi:tetratricopeptide (TPR) repeat protein